jgi:hypothetical protein
LKQLIVLAATLPVMLAFIMQFALIQVNHSRAIRAEEVVHNARIDAELNGGFTEGTRELLVSQIANIYDVAPQDIAVESRVTGDRSPRIISYRISIPVPKIIAANRLFGIDDRDNRGRHVIEGAVQDLSEYLEDAAPDDAVLLPDDTALLPDDADLLPDEPVSPPEDLIPEIGGRLP